MTSPPLATSAPRAPEVVAPSQADGFVGLVSRVVGGPIGRHARPATGTSVATLTALVAATLSWLIVIARQLPCRDLPGHPANLYGSLCYSDIPLLYRARGLVDGRIPYLGQGPEPTFEYPVLTGAFAELTRRITVLLGVPVGPGLSTDQGLIAADRFMVVNLLLLGVLFLAAVWLTAQTTPGRPWDAMLLAVSPCVLAAGAVNWDMLVVALTALGFWLWSRDRPGLAGAAWGLGMAAKLYPLLLLGPLLILCLRARRLREFGSALAGFLIAWSLVNLPVVLFAQQAWVDFWRFNSERSGDFGSIWYVLSLAGHPVPHLNVVTLVLLGFACAAIAAVLLVAPRRPRLAQGAFLVVAAFLLINKVYSPQYVLWLLPLVVLARPKWRDVLIFTAGEICYFVAIWWHLGGYDDPGSGGPDTLYWCAVLLRIGTQSYVVVQVVRDVLDPRRDPVRATGADDPAGGSLDRADDAGWVARLHDRLRAGPTGAGATGAGATGAQTEPAPTSSTPSGIVTLAQAWLGSRLVLAVTIAVVGLVTGRTFDDLVANWDVQHFENIALHGYLSDPKTMAFFPALPMLMRLGAAIGISPVVGGMLVSLLASGAAAAALYRLGRDPERRAGGVWPAVLWLFAPTAVFTLVPYTEALFCAAAFWAWERARRDRWWQAALLTAAACSIRVSGLFLIGALAVLILTSRGLDVPGRLRRLAWLLLPTAVLAAYATFLHALTGSWTAWYHAQAEGWPRGLTWPWQSFLNTLPAAFGDYPQWAWMFRFEIVSMAVGVVVTIACLCRRWWAEAAWVGVQVLAFSLSYWFFSVNRAVLLWFPLWLLLGGWVSRRLRGPRWAQIVLGVGALVALAVMVWWTFMFTTGRWAS